MQIIPPSLIGSAVIAEEVGADINLLVQRALAQLPSGAPFIQPKHLAPVLGITEEAVRVHCRNYRPLRHWRGSYRFYTDDGQHVDHLRGLVKLIIWSGRKLPAELRPGKMRVH